MCTLPDQDEWEARIAAGLAALTPEQRAHALSQSDYAVWGNSPPFRMGGENGAVGYYDTRTECENAIIIGLGVFEDDSWYERVFGPRGAKELEQ